MVFGISGNRSMVGFLVALGLLVAVPAAAQVDTLCTLPMPVPPASDVSIQLTNGHNGMGAVLTWPNLPDNASTCVSVLGVDSLDIEVTVTGDYADEFDRMLQFSFMNTGEIGSTTNNRVICRWLNVNSSLSGHVGGEVNLSNTGGLWRRDHVTGDWSRLDAGFPQYFAYFNMDAFAMLPDGSRLAALSAGTNPGVFPRGLYRAVGDGGWQPIGASVFGRARTITAVAFGPGSSDAIAVGTQNSGLFISTDGGQTFIQYRRELAPGSTDFPQNGVYRIPTLTWEGNRLWVAVTAWDLFSTGDMGQTWTRHSALRVISDLEANPPVTVFPSVNRITVDPEDASHVYVGLENHGVYESADGGTSWTSLGGDWIVVDPDNPGSWRHSVQTIAVDPADSQHLVVGTKQQGIWYTQDGAAHWALATTPVDSLRGAVVKVARLSDGTYRALRNGAYLVRSDDGGASWTQISTQLADRNALAMIVDASDNLFVPTYGAGIYASNTPIEISKSILSTETDADLLDLDLGLFIAFGPGLVQGPTATSPGQDFRVNAQDYQGWIVWRANGGDPDRMEMIGRYDKTNPETCIVGYCGDDNYYLEPNCFAERRAACFDFSHPGTVSFYDGDVFNGFSYYYAVTPFDYGDVSMVFDPVSISSPLLFPSRFPNDPYASVAGDGNRKSLQVNATAALPTEGGEIYVYPNPLRRSAGIAGSEGEEVVWTNLPPDSHIEVFTLAGDRVVDLLGEAQVAGNMYWNTRNDTGELIASGVYMWRCIMPERGDFWGKLVVIR